MSEAASVSRLFARRRPIKDRLNMLVIGLAILLLALYGWVAQALRPAR